jgi:signal transduction histidine kinase
MGSRGRSIRLRIYFLVAIPLVALVALIGYGVTTAVTNAISLDRAPNLVNATALPAANFGVYVEAERAAAVVYLFQPTAASLQAYQAAIAATDKAKPAFAAAMNSQGTVGTQTADATKMINGIVSGMSKLPTLRNAVKARLLSPLDALGFYSQGLGDEIQLFLIEAESVVPTAQLSQAIGLIATVQAREQLSQEHALLGGMLAGQRMSQRDHVAFTNMAAARQADMTYATYILSPANLAIYHAALAKSGPMQATLASIEQVVAAGTPVAKLPVTLAQWQQLLGTLLQDQYNGGVAVVNSILVADHNMSHAAWVRVGVTSGVGLLGLLLTLLVSTLGARGIIRRLGGLERNARQLAEVQLPDVVGRLRRGETVDANAGAPPLRIGRDEIGRVGQAFELVRQTAVRAAVEEARLRQGLNDVFRSLARRSQSLLYRQLTLLDQMERRASDPEALDDLFRLDHLTTRMRRHAEGLVILAGAPPGRGWSSPVRMVDVMRGAIAEVEDYARVSVATRSQAALAGPAVADVIHLLAELIENATMLSPPYTSVRVSGDTVANGFAIEVEDRGLGMSPPRLAELNERLANPPEFNPSDSEQLGLFVVGQLAKRHGIRVTLKASPYGGTAAIVLIPRHLVVTEEAFRAGLPGEPASVAMAQLTANGSHAEPSGQGAGSGFTEIGGVPGLAQTPGVRISGPLRRSQGIPERTQPISGRGAHAVPIPWSISGPEPASAPALGPANGAGGAGPDELPRRHHDQPETTAGAGTAPNGAGGRADRGGRTGFDVFRPRRHARPGGETPVPPGDGGPARPARSERRIGDPLPDEPGPGAAPGMGTAGAGAGAPLPGNGPYIASPPYPVAGSSPYPGPASGPSGPGAPFPGTGSTTPFPGSGAPSYRDQPAPFPGWTLPGTPGTPGASSASGGRAAPGAGPGAGAGAGVPAGPATPMTPVASPRPGQASGPPWELSRETGPLPVVPGDAGPGTEAGGNGDIMGLPRRVKQASLAPQLRADPPQRRTTVVSGGPQGFPGTPGSPGSPGPSPAEIRQTMSALQRGWQEGRSQRMTGGMPGGPAAGSGADSPPGGGQGRDSTTNEEARGGSDGS